MTQVMVLGGYGAVGAHASRTLAVAGIDVVVAGRRRDPAERLAAELGAEPALIDATDPAAVRSAAERVEAVVDCSGRESVPLAEAVLAGDAHLIDVSADHAYQHAVAQRLRTTGDHGREALFSVGLTPGLTNLLAADLAARAPGDPIELVGILGAGEDHGRAARDWIYSLFGRSFVDGQGARVRNFTDRRRQRLPHVGVCWVYRVDTSDQHVLSVELRRPVLTRVGTDSRLVTGLLAAASPVPGAARAMRALEPAVPWPWLGTDRWVMAAGRPGRVERWASGREQSRGTGIVAGLATQLLLDAPTRGVTHLHQRTTITELTPALEDHDIEVAGA